MILALLTAIAAPTTDLAWNLSVAGQPVGTRTLKVKVLPGDEGTRRILEAWTQVDGSFGPMQVKFRQRLTAHAQGGQPASFHSVVDENGDAIEVQGRWSAAGWTVTTNLGRGARTAEFSLQSIDLSTPDLIDPLSSVGLQGRSSARVLSAISGDVLEGSVTSLGARDLMVQGTKVPVVGWSWASPEGKSDFFYSTEGYLVKFRMILMGVEVEGMLTQPPPGGVDDFPVASGRPDVEKLPL